MMRMFTKWRGDPFYRPTSEHYKAERREVERIIVKGLLGTELSWSELFKMHLPLGP